MGKWYVYQYNDPINGLPMYFGKGRGGRMYDHLTRNDHAHPFTRRLTELEQNGYPIEPFKVFEDAIESKVLLKERELVAAWGTIKVIRGVKRGPLLNLTRGGDGLERVKQKERKGIILDEPALQQTSISIIEEIEKTNQHRLEMLKLKEKERNAKIVANAEALIKETQKLKDVEIERTKMYEDRAKERIEFAERQRLKAVEEIKRRAALSQKPSKFNDAKWVEFLARSEKRQAAEKRIAHIEKFYELFKFDLTKITDPPQFKESAWSKIWFFFKLFLISFFCQ